MSFVNQPQSLQKSIDSIEKIYQFTSYFFIQNVFGLKNHLQWIQYELKELKHIEIFALTYYYIFSNLVLLQKS